VGAAEGMLVRLAKRIAGAEAMRGRRVNRRLKMRIRRGEPGFSPRITRIDANRIVAVELLRFDEVISGR
jgi:hypothetical protein